MFWRKVDTLRERRGPVRVPYSQQLWCLYPGSRVRCQGLDLSASGARVSLPTALAPGTRVELRPPSAVNLLGRRRVLGRVVWSRQEDNGRATTGLAFDSLGQEETWAYSAVREAIGGSPFRSRINRRLQYRLNVSLADANREHLASGVTRNLSLGGACVATRASLTVGQILVLYVELPDRPAPLSLPCRVVNLQEDTVNLRFFRPGRQERQALEGLLGGQDRSFSSRLGGLVRRVLGR